MPDADRDGSASPFTALGFDYGERRIGVAVGQSITGSARPLTTLKSRGLRPDWETLSALVDEWRPERFVVGMPSHADGSDHALKPRIDRFCRQLTGRYGVPVSIIDERLSSYEAASRGGADVDAGAACVILETWFAADAKPFGPRDVDHP